MLSYKVYSIYSALVIDNSQIVGCKPTLLPKQSKLMPSSLVPSTVLCSIVKCSNDLLLSIFVIIPSVPP